MVITKTPYRCSFFGGGTDHPEWFNINGGEVLTSSIDKYSYILAARRPIIEEGKFLVRYSEHESSADVAGIHHRSVRACLRSLGWDEALTITHDGDLPARSGIGSSSVFTVGLLQSLYALKKTRISGERLGKLAIHVEREVAHECVGYQDQIETAVGGLNHISFSPGGRVEISNINLSKQALSSFNSHLLLLYTGHQRDGTILEAKKVSRMSQNATTLSEIQAMVKPAVLALRTQNWEEFGSLLDKYWSLKRGLSHGVSTESIDDLYGLAKKHGILGGKMLGAGGGGFLLLFAPPPTHASLLSALPSSLTRVPFQFSFTGSEVIYDSERE